MTPMMAQWKACRDQAGDALLLFRLGDFYEAFHEDAHVMSRELDLTLTERQGVPMCGIPWHTSDSYIEKLVAKGYRVAIAEQTEAPGATKGLVRRKIVRVVSPATLVPTSADSSHNFFAAVVHVGDRWGLACLDVAESRIFVLETRVKAELANELFRRRPKELLIGRALMGTEQAFFDELGSSLATLITTEEDWCFAHAAAYQALCQHFKVASLDGYGVREMGPAIQAAGALLLYLRNQLLLPLDHVHGLKPHFLHEALLLDRATLTNLEILESASRGGISLFDLMNETQTPLGKRLLASWLKSPLVDPDAISLRQEAIGWFLAQEIEAHANCAAFDGRLRKIRDLERQIYRVKMGLGGPRECVALAASCSQLPYIKQFLENSSSARLSSLARELPPLSELVSLVSEALVDEPPARVSDGGLFRQGYAPELDALMRIKTSGHEWLASYQTELRNQTGIKTLKIGFNRLFGYYIEVSKGQVGNVPETFTRKQTLANGERYTTSELKAYEEKVLSAAGRIQEIEERLFETLRQKICAYQEQLVCAAERIAEIDCLRALAILAQKRHYVRPTVNTNQVISIEQGRHPIIETLTSASTFVPNDCVLDSEKCALMCITGPNMAGKSTYIRQVALIVIMAQIGSYVPAKNAQIGIVDQVFSRIGASDDLTRGQSTFMVEMAQTAAILHQATPRSLVILDEIGRGTSTYDGISIAWAVAEFLLRGSVRPKTLFATHYYELTELAHTLEGVVNYTVAISEAGGHIRFLHKIVAGTADRSYGIHVASLAGLPEEVIVRATSKLQELEAMLERRIGKTAEPVVSV